MTVKCITALFALFALFALSTTATAQVQPGPNIAPNGTPFTTSPRFGYLGPPAAMPFGGPPVAPPPLGWVYGPFTTCTDPPNCRVVVVNVGVDGVNVRIAPNGPVVAALANGVPVAPLRQEGMWVLVAPACPLVPTFTFSITAGGVPLSICGF